MTNEPDLDALVSSGALDSETERRIRHLAMGRLADAAFRSDVSYSIEMARAGWAAREKQAARAEAADARGGRRRGAKGAL